MPLITTHNYFATDVYKKCPKNISSKISPKKDIYELFAQGFDTLLFYEFFKLKKENLVNYCHTHHPGDYFINLINNIKNENLINNSEILASLYGHLTHYVLDTTMHPYITYKCGIYEKNEPKTIKYNGKHNNMEMQIDAYFYEKKNQKPFKNFKIHKHLITKNNFSKDLINLLNINYKETFNIKNGGQKYQKGKINMYYSYKFLVEDKTGIKKFFYTIIDFVTPKKVGLYKYYSSHINKVDNTIFNLEHNTWYQPWLKKTKSTESFFDLYDKALNNCIILFNKTNEFLNNKITEKEYKKYLGDKSYLTGLPWKEKKEIKHLEF